MTPPNTGCPFCGSLKVMSGKVVGAEGQAGFKPDETVTGFVFTLRYPFAFAFGPTGQYCATCGMIWAKADTKDAAKFLKKFATEDLKNRLANTEQETAPPTRRGPPSK